MKAVFGALLVLLAQSVWAANGYKIEKVKTIGLLKHKVIFQSPDVVYQKETKTMKGLVVAMWGTERFEVVDATYKCTDKKSCSYVDNKHLAMFRLCTVKEKEVNCQGRISGNLDSYYARDVIVSEGPDAVYDEYGQRRNEDYYYPEFPVRVEDEYADILF